MTAKPPVQTLDTLKARLCALRATGMTWRQIATEFDDVPAGTLCAIAKGREPAKPAIRAALGLPVKALAEVCPVHGKVCAVKHKAQPVARKPRRTRKARNLWNMAMQTARCWPVGGRARAMRERALKDL